jgi:hypothetical protein
VLLGSFGGLLLLVAAVVGVIGSHTLSPARITKQEARMIGCCPAFLDALPAS